MSFDLYREEVDNRLASLRPVREPEPGMFDNFLRGSGQVAMQTFAKAGRAASMAAAPLAMALEKSPNSTELQDKFFKAHDEIFGRAVDSWTPKPTEVGAAGQIVGQLLGTLPMVMASPALTVAQTQLSTGEDLVRKGVDADKAQAVGAVQAAGLGLGIWVPILGQTLTQRVLMGGAGFNVAQGLATRAASAKLLEDTPGAEEFKTFDPMAMTLDVLLGAAFGGIAHINPRMRAEGDRWHAKLAEWGKGLKPSEVDALATLRQAQHLNADSLPGKPVDVEDVNAHVARMRQALDDLANDRPVNVEDMPAGRYELDAARQAEAERVLAEMEFEARAEQAKKAAIESEASAERATAKPIPDIQDPLYRSAIEAMANETGWAEVGGRIIRDPQSGQVTGRSSWVPRAEWWPGRPKDLSEAKAQKAISKALSGEPLKPAEQRLIDYMLGYANERIVPALRRLEGIEEAERARVANDLMAEGLDGHIRDIADADTIARAAKIDEGALEKAATRYENDREAFIREAERIVDEHAARQQDAGATPDGRGQADQPAPRPAEAATARPADTETAGLDPLASTAQRFAAEHPDLPIVIGKNADGSDITTTPRQWLDDAETDFMRAQEDAKLFEVAAGCLLGGGR
jgi:hypothetical protein